MNSLRFTFRISQPSISNIISECTDAIVKTMFEEYVHFPKDKSEWLKISNDIERLWGFPNAIGLLDGNFISF